MRAKNNGDAHVCALNLLRITRGEVAYERTKGVSTEFIDQVSTEVAPLAVADAKRQLEIFEPRINVDDYDILAAMEDRGDVDNDFDMSLEEQK